MARSGSPLGADLASLDTVNLAEPETVFNTLPAPLPDYLSSKLAWTGTQFTNQSTYTYHLTVEDVVEINTAMHQFKALGLDGDLVSRNNFSLPGLGRKLHQVQQDLYGGQGFALIRGIRPSNYSVEDLTLVYLGLQAHIADQCGRQDRRGNMLVHIIADGSTKMKSTHHRHSTAPITFHNEEDGDIVSWLTRSSAAAGGECIISSAYTVYNVLAATRPDLVRTLMKSDWPFVLPKFHCRPVMYWLNNRLVINFGRTALLGSAAHPRPQSLPALNAQQLEALDAIEEIARATELCIGTQPGDIHLINNLAILHRREGFVDSAGEKRHLVRMRLRDSMVGWELPSELQCDWKKAFEGEANRVWHVEPMPDGFFPLRSQAN